MTTPREVKVAPNIYRTLSVDGHQTGWRVYVRRRDPKTGTSQLKPQRFDVATTLEELEEFRDSYKVESRKQRREARTTAAAAAVAIAGTFAQDASTYLALETVKAMPSYKDRARDITRWVAIFGPRLRTSIRARDIDEQLQLRCNGGAAASTVNNWRTALQDLWTTLDGVGAANPVRATIVFEEPEPDARGLPYAFVMEILDAIPDARSHSHQRETKVTDLKSKPRIMLEALTGMRPSQVGQLKNGKHFSIADRWYVIPRSQKGKQRRRRRQPRPATRKYMTDRQAEAFARFVEVKCDGPYSASSRRRIFNAAVQKAEATIREQLHDPTFAFPSDLVPRDLRHSFGSEILRRTDSLETTAEMLDHSTTRMTRRYALAAIPETLRKAALAFEAGLPERTTAPVRTVAPPKPPRRRKDAHT